MASQARTGRRLKPSEPGLRCAYKKIAGEALKNISQSLHILHGTGFFPCAERMAVLRRLRLSNPPNRPIHNKCWCLAYRSFAIEIMHLGKIIAHPKNIHDFYSLCTFSSFRASFTTPRPAPRNTRFLTGPGAISSRHSVFLPTGLSRALHRAPIRKFCPLFIGYQQLCFRTVLLMRSSYA